VNSSTTVAARRARILIVDDEPLERKLLELMLAPEGYDLLTAVSGEEAVAMVTRKPPDLVLLDVRMPGVDGYQVVAQLKGNVATKNIPVIMVTSLNERSATMLGLNAGAEDFLSKPIDRAELCVRVKNLLRLKEYADYHDRYGQLLEGEAMSRAADLAASERLYRETFDEAPVGIVHVGLDGHWLRVNQRLCDLLGYSREELQSGAQELTQPEHATEDAESFRRTITGTVRHHVVDEKQYRRRDGSALWARINISVHRDSAGQAQHFIAVFEDITERRVLEAQVRQASKLEAIGGLAAGIAHDLNNLLSIILGYSELLAADLKDGDPLRADLGEIKGAGLRAVDLTRQLLAFSRQQVLEPKIVDLSQIIRGLERMLGRLIGEDVELVAICAPAPAKIVVDPGQMEQVIMNLVVNARDAMPNGGKLTVATSGIVFDDAYAASHAGVEAGPHVLLTVSDTGSGMAPATLARMFEPFFTTKEVGKGTGLGLATVFGIVNQSGGTIAVDSQLGAGTTFKICFPACDEIAIPLTSSAPSDRRPVRGSETILIVEDDAGVRSLACTILRKYGYDVLEAQSGGDAFLLCEQHAATIHLLLTDMVMPRMSGRQLAERLHSLRPAMKVLCMSGYADDKVMHPGTVDATFAFIQKPITPETLARKVRDVLDATGQVARAHPQ
jgi:PAS domain S-box-containing protein